MVKKREVMTRVLTKYPELSLNENCHRLVVACRGVVSSWSEEGIFRMKRRVIKGLKW